MTNPIKKSYLRTEAIHLMKCNTHSKYPTPPASKTAFSGPGAWAGKSFEKRWISNALSY
jgi:hypothetical protein